MNNIDKWVSAFYLIEAKKAVDGLWFMIRHKSEIAQHFSEEYAYKLYMTFYIYACVVLDRRFNPNSDKSKKQICKENNVVESIYYERDKNIAHKDFNYSDCHTGKTFHDLKKQLKAVLLVCSDILPVEVTVDYVPYDRVLFRLIKGITQSKECEIELEKYSGKNEFPKYTNSMDIHNVEQLKTINRNMPIFMYDGLTAYEGLQNRQDYSIKYNIQNDTHMWCFPEKENWNWIEKVKQIGFIDEYGVIKIPKPENTIAFTGFLIAMEKAGFEPDWVKYKRKQIDFYIKESAKSKENKS